MADAEAQVFHPLIQLGKWELESLNSLCLIPRGALRHVDMDQGRLLMRALLEKWRTQKQGVEPLPSPSGRVTCSGKLTLKPIYVGAVLRPLQGKTAPLGRLPRILSPTINGEPGSFCER